MPVTGYARSALAWFALRDGIRHGWRYRDTALPAALVALVYVAAYGPALPFASTPAPYLACLLPGWWWAPVVATLAVVGQLHLPELDPLGPGCRKARLERYESALFHRYCTIHPPPTIRFTKHRTHRTIHVVAPAPGTKDAAMEALAVDLALGYDRHVTVRPAGPKSALWDVSIWDRDILAEDPPWTEDYHVRPEAVPFGFDEDGHVVYVPLLRRNAIVAGIPDAGKSSLLNGLIATLLRMPPELIHLHLWDPQSGLAFMHWEELPNVHTAEDAASIRRDLNGLLRIMDEREHQMREAKTDLAHVSPRWPWHVVVLDETADVVAELDDPAFIVDLSRLERKGRKAAITVILCSQTFRATIIPPDLRDNSLVKIGLRVARETNTNMVMGEGAVGDGVSLKSIPDGQPGRGFINYGKGDLEFRGFRLAGSNREEVAAMLTARWTTDRDLSPPSGPPVPGLSPPGSPDAADTDPTKDMQAVFSADSLLSGLTGESSLPSHERVRLFVLDHPECSTADIAEALGMVDRTVRRQAAKAGCVQSHRGAWSVPSSVRGGPNG
jgi:hypothetical protein